MKLRLACLAVLATLAVSSPAIAQSDDMAPARLERLDAQASAANFKVLHARAIEIAKANGMISVREIDLRKGVSWKIEGRDAQGGKLEILLSGQDGKVLKIERD